MPKTSKKTELKETTDSKVPEKPKVKKAKTKRVKKRKPKIKLHNLEKHLIKKPEPKPSFIVQIKAKLNSLTQQAKTKSTNKPKPNFLTTIKTKLSSWRPKTDSDRANNRASLKNNTQKVWGSLKSKGKVFSHNFVLSLNKVNSAIKPLVMIIKETLIHGWRWLSCRFKNFNLWLVKPHNIKANLKVEVEKIETEEEPETTSAFASFLTWLKCRFYNLGLLFSRPRKKKAKLAKETESLKPTEITPASSTPEEKPSGFHPYLRSLRNGVIGFVALALVLVGVSSVSYIGFLQYSYNRIEEDTKLKVDRNRTWYLRLDEEYKIVSYNVSSGIYSSDFSSQYYTATNLNGTKITGDNFTSDLQTINDNILGAVRYVKALDPDLYLFQSVDYAATRSHKLDEVELIGLDLRRFSKIYSPNYQTMYQFWPPAKPVGIINSGTYTVSKYKVTSVIRKQLPISENFISKFGAQDAGISLCYLPISRSDHELVLMNVDLSEYSGKAWQKQFDTLLALAQAEYDKGNYVIVGGDFKADIAYSVNRFNGDYKQDSELIEISNTSLGENFDLVIPDNYTTQASYRVANEAYEQGHSLEYTSDGFFVSDNLTATSTIIDTRYRYSNHNPIQMSFTLKPQ